MSSSGWYPDPSGVKGRYRYWDGRRWSHTAADISSPTPPTEDGSSHPRGSRNDRTWIVALVVLALVVAVIVAAVLHATGRPPLNPAVEDTNSSTPTVSAWNEAIPPSPTPTSSLVPPPAPMPSSSIPPPASPVAQAASQCEGEQLTYMPLTMCGIPGWADDPPPGMDGQILAIQLPTQMATIGIGTIPYAGFPMGSAAAAQVDSEVGYAYEPGTSVQVVFDMPLQISGQDAWRRTCLLTGTGWGTIYTTIVIIDLDGAMDAKGDVIDGWGFFRGMYPSSRPDLGEAEESALSSLTILA